MSRLAALCGKLKKEVDLGNGVTIELKMCKVKHLSELAEAVSGAEEGKISGKQIEAMANVLKEMLREAVPDATEEEIEEIVILKFAELSTALTDMLNSIFPRVPATKKK